MKRKTAKELLAESFVELAQTIPVDKIIVQNIADNCGYSTATFYRQFKDKYDLMTWVHEQRYEALARKYVQNNCTWHQVFLEAANSFHNERYYLINLITHTSGQDSFVRYMTEVHQKILRLYLIETGRVEKITELLDMHIRIFCLGTSFIIMEWLFGKYKVSREELVELFENSIPIPLRGYMGYE